MLNKKQIGLVGDFYDWAVNVLAPGLRVTTYYNGNQAYYLAGFLSDYSSRILGYATMRQVRVDNSMITFLIFIVKLN